MTNKINQVLDVCLANLVEFRNFHLKVSLNYLQDTLKGTGASDFKTLLTEFSDNTKLMVTDTDKLRRILPNYSN